jgi:hypothetical protein
LGASDRVNDGEHHATHRGPRAQANRTSGTAPAAVPQVPRPPHVFAALIRYVNYRQLWLGTMAGAIGQWMQQIALGWVALIITNSPGFVGMVTFAAGVPFLVVAPLAGGYIDRLDNRRLLVASQVLGPCSRPPSRSTSSRRPSPRGTCSPPRSSTAASWP